MDLPVSSEKENCLQIIIYILIIYALQDTIYTRIERGSLNSIRMKRTAEPVLDPFTLQQFQVTKSMQIVNI